MLKAAHIFMILFFGVSTMCAVARTAESLERYGMRCDALSVLEEGSSCMQRRLMCEDHPISKTFPRSDRVSAVCILPSSAVGSAVGVGLVATHTLCQQLSSRFLLDNSFYILNAGYLIKICIDKGGALCTLGKKALSADDSARLKSAFAGSALFIGSQLLESYTGVNAWWFYSLSAFATG